MTTYLEKTLLGLFCLFISLTAQAESTTINLSSEICYNGIDDNGDGFVDGKDPLCQTLIVTTTVDNLDGDISSVENLLSNKGADGEISLREAIAATQSIASRDSFHVIGFRFLNYDLGHFYYQDDGIAGQVTAANKVRTTSSDDSTLDDKDPDYPRSWFQFQLDSSLPTLSNNVLIDGYHLRQTQMNTAVFGGALNTIIRIELMATGNFPVFNIEEAIAADNIVVIRGLSMHGPSEVIKIDSGTRGEVWLTGNYIGIDPTALTEQRSSKNIITIRNANRPIIIGSNKDGENDDGEINLISGVVSRQAGVFVEKSSEVTIRKNYFGVGLKGNNDLGSGDGIAISTLGGSYNNFDNNVISFQEVAFDLYQSEKDSIQNNLIGVHSVDNTNLVMTNSGGSCSESKELVIINNTIANSRTGWHFYQTKNSHFIKNEVFGNLNTGVSFVDESFESNQKNENNFIYKNIIHDNLIGILLALDADNNAIIQNSIYANGSSGIDLSTNSNGADGITDNDLDDTDSGANQLLNFPTLTITNYNITTITAAINLDVNDAIVNIVEGYRIELFANSSTTDRGGEIYLGYLDVAGDVTNAEVSLDLPNEVTKDFYISATTSILKVKAFADVAPQLAFGATSEFSESVPMPVAEICDNNKDDDGDGLIDCADPDCANYANAGTIIGEEEGCETLAPTVIESASTPFNDIRETIFYQWQKSGNNGEDWEDITGATKSTYQPTTIISTTIYRRLIKKHTCNDWIASNEVEKKVKTNPIANIITAPVANDLCAKTAYDFAAEDAGEGAEYTWHFGESAQQDSFQGKGTHSINYTLLDNNNLTQTVTLTVEKNGCITSETNEFNIHPILEITNVSTTQPSNCGGADGSISVMAIGETGRCMALSIDGGISYLADNQLTVNGLSTGAYDLYLRYCDGECPVNVGIINLSDPAQIKVNDDAYSGYCPGVLFKGRVTTNDTIGDNPVLSLPVDATYGKVTLEQSGEFTYLPITSICGTDQFSYQICNGNTGCCATATVTVEFGDNMPPTFGDLPTDITIGIDDELPVAAIVTATDNCPTTTIDFIENSTQDNSACGKHDYTITRKWTATDQCGNATDHIQTIEVVDETAPDIFRIYTLPNGTKMVAGVMEFTSQHWKTVNMPIDFIKNPILFTQLITDEEATPTTIRLKNITPTQFEIRLQEEEANDSIHTKEKIAWMAIERGTQTTSYQFQADTIGVTHGWTTIPFFDSFDNIPLFFANMQTIKDTDASSLRNTSVNWNNAKVRIQEENSIDENSAHTSETTGYLAIDDIGDLTDANGEKIGEVGRTKVNSEWSTVNVTSRYNNPVVIANSLSIDHFDPATVRIRNVTATSFEIRIEEWDYLDGIHGTESVSYMVIEGSLPLTAPDFCENGEGTVDFTNELIALDNTNEILSIEYDETFDYTESEQLINRHWFATDACGNKGIATQTIVCPGLAMKGKTVLQGAMLGSPEVGLMRDDLRQAGLIPLVEPYTDLIGFEHFGSGGGETLKESLLTIEGEDAIVDWIFLELRSRLDKDIVIATASALLQRDGDIISPKGDSLIVFASAPESNFYVAVRHRNHVGMVSNIPFEFSADNIPNLDFTNTELTGCANVGITMDDQNTMWAGDLNQDGKIIFQGPNNDIFHILLEVVTDQENKNFITNFVSTTYSAGDFNLDGKVIFQGPNNDRSALLFSTILLHPENVQYISNFILEVNFDCGQ